MQNQYYYLAVFEDIKMLISYWNCFLVWATSITVDMVIEKKKRKLKDVFYKVDSRNYNAYRATFLMLLGLDNVFAIARCPVTPDKVLFQNVLKKILGLKRISKGFFRKRCTLLIYSLILWTFSTPEKLYVLTSFRVKYHFLLDHWR